MTAPKFTAADVVVGATVTVRETWKNPTSVTVVTHDPVTVAKTAHGYAYNQNGRGVPIEALLSPQKVEILDVVPPKPEYVTGSIYRVTSNTGRPSLREFFADGSFGGVGSGRGTFSPESYARMGWTIGDRVLVIDYPSAVTVSNAERGALVSNAGMLIQKAIRAESERGVK